MWSLANVPRFPNRGSSFKSSTSDQSDIGCPREVWAEYLCIEFSGVYPIIVNLTLLMLASTAGQSFYR